MKLTLLLPFLAIGFTSLSQDYETISCQLKKKYDRYVIRWIDNGRFMLIGANKKSFNYVGDGALFDADGNFVRKVEGKKVGSLADKDNVLYNVSPNAMRQIYKKYMYNTSSARMYKFKMERSHLSVEEIASDDRTWNFDLNDGRIEGGMNLVSWDIVKLDKHVLRSLFVYNYGDQSKISVVRVDYNTSNGQFDVKNKVWSMDETSLNGWSRPSLNILKSFEDGNMLCLISTSNYYSLCTLSSEMEPVISEKKMELSGNYFVKDGKLLKKSNGDYLLAITKSARNSSGYGYRYGYEVCGLKGLDLAEHDELIIGEKGTSLKFSFLNEAGEEQLIKLSYLEQTDIGLDENDNVLVAYKDRVKVFMLNDDADEQLGEKFYDSRCILSERNFVTLNETTIGSFYEEEGEFNGGDLMGKCFFNPKTGQLAVVNTEGGKTIEIHYLQDSELVRE